MSEVIEFISSDKGHDDYSTSSSESPGEGMPSSNPLIRQSKTTNSTSDTVDGKLII